jgi:Methylamine utilisation protein MauE
MKKRIPDIICGLLILLFAYAAISKLIDRQYFQAVLARMLLIKSFAGFISFALPVTELLVCILLFMPATRPLGLYASCGLMIAFTLYIVFMILFAPHLPCSCGGFLQKLNWSQHLVFNLVFIALSITAIKLYQSNKNIVATQQPSVQRLQGKS